MSDPLAEVLDEAAMAFDGWSHGGSVWENLARAARDHIAAEIKAEYGRDGDLSFLRGMVIAARIARTGPPAAPEPRT